MDHLQADIDNLEREKKELKEKERIAIKKSDVLTKSGNFVWLSSVSYCLIICRRAGNFNG